MNRCLRRLFSYFLLVLFVGVARAEQPAISVIDTYGLHDVSQKAVLEAVGLRVGDPAPDATQIKSIVERLQAIPGVERAKATIVRVQRQKTPPEVVVETILYVGILEAGRPAPSFRTAPTADVELPEIIQTTHREFEDRLAESIRRGDFSSDSSHGYALLGDETARDVQRRLVPLTDQYYDRLVDVLHNAKSAKQRAIAAWMLGYASDKKRAVRDLGVANRDPDSTVRNNTMRVLGVIVEYAQMHPELSLDGPVDWYLEMLESVQWSDRNKAMMVLCGLSKNSDPAIVGMLRERSLPTLIEMSRWQVEGHAMMAYYLVGKVAQMTDEEIHKAWDSDDRERVIARALEKERG
jgi:hypothetical protein